MTEEPALRAVAYGQARIFQSERDIQITEHHHHAPSGAPTGPASVRVPLSAPLRASLRDRAELRRALLEAADTGDGVHVLHGFGGCGKTAVARWLFDQMTPSRVTLWVDASTESQLRAGMLAVAADRGASPEEVRAAQEGRRAAADLVWQRLDASAEPWLLVLDNADDPRPLREGWLRASPRGMTLVTSRQAVDPAWHGVRARLHRVEMLPVMEAAQLLHDLAPGDHQPDAILRLAQRLGCHPLALTLAAGFLSQQLLESWTIEEYLERLGEDPVALLDRGAEAESGARERLSRTWQLSLDALEARGLPEAVAVLRLLACLGRAPVPVGLLAPSVVQEVGVPGAAAERIEAGLRGLLSASLVDLVEIPGYAGERPVRCLTAHGLLLETVAAATPAPQRAELYAAAAELVSRAVPQGERAGAVRLVEPHLLALLDSAHAGGVLDAARRVRDEHEAAGRWADALPHAAGLAKAAASDRDTGTGTGTAASNIAAGVADAIALGKVMYMGGDFAGAEPVLRAALDAATARSEEAPLLLADAYVELGWCFGRLGRFEESIHLARQGGEIRERVLGPTHADTVESLYMQVDCHYGVGRFGAALRLTERLMVLLPDLHGDRSGEIAARTKLMRAATMRVGLISAQEAGSVVASEVRELSWDQVWDESQEALRAYAAQFGAAHPHTLAARHNFAMTSWEHGDRAVAVDEMRKVVDARNAELGEEHPFTIEALAELARMLGLRGDAEEAGRLAEKAHADAHRILGPEHPITARCVAAQQAVDRPMGRED
ncbi:tetratricopeptide repeat protein [Streptomyces angustmyceticus]|uniref:tetratricopeptide repeat protein n=1 Tax=Streptomyces angustmyceticus TaxID=285578 RepID=UPI00344ED008